ncbi:MAG: DUF1318 domain-containing protein [Planctomycetes bacterium]|nr:DUF1318 domain-containing protein [Planctomycetota bacterium]
MSLFDEKKMALVLAVSSALAVVSACININIYFPEAKIEDTADQVVNEVRQEPAPASTDSSVPQNPAAGPEEAEGSQKAPESSSFAVPSRFESGFELRGVFIAYQEKKIETDIDDPVVKKIIESLKKRYPQLQTFFDKKAVGEKIDGYVEARDEDKLSLEEKKTLKKLIEAENKDRKNLYEQIAVLNKLEASRVKDIQAIYAKKWIAKAKKGWWVQDEKGKWIQKPTDPEKEGGGKKKEGLEV